MKKAKGLTSFGMTILLEFAQCAYPEAGVIPNEVRDLYLICDSPPLAGGEESEFYFFFRSVTGTVTSSVRSFNSSSA